MGNLLNYLFKKTPIIPKPDIEEISNLEIQMAALKERLERNEVQSEIDSLQMQIDGVQQSLILKYTMDWKSIG